MKDDTLNILEISSSGRHEGSVTRALSENLIAELGSLHDATNIVRRDVGTKMPFVDQNWIEANFTPDESRTQEHRDALAYSSELVEELKSADAVVIGVPVYNFSIPASLKAWIDMVARARLTFRYTENGPVGLLEGKKVYLVVASGGVPVGSPMDFATPYLRHVLSFLGITDVEVTAA